MLNLCLTLSHRDTCALFKAINNGAIGFDAQRKTVEQMRAILTAWAVQYPGAVGMMESAAQTIIDARNAPMPAPPAAIASAASAASAASVPPAPPSVLQSIADAIDAQRIAAPAAVQTINPLTPPEVITGNHSQPIIAPPAPAAVMAQPIPAAPFAAADSAPQEAPQSAVEAPQTAAPPMPVPHGPASQAPAPSGRLYAREVFADLAKKAPQVYASIPPYLTIPAWPQGHFAGAEAPNMSFRWTAETLIPALIGLATPPAVPMLFFGPAGTGKTEMARQLAARCGRPFTRINCNRHTESADILGDVGLNANGTEWVDGPFALAAAVPHGAAIVLVDEPSYTNAGALACLSPVLERGGASLSLPKTGKVLKVHADMAVIFADNTALAGDVTGAYHNRFEMGEDIRQRLYFKLKFDYLPAAEERALLAERIKAETGKTATAAALAPLMKILSVCRQQCDAGVLQGAPSFRGAVAFALLVAHGVPSDQAFEIAITHQAPAESQQALREIFRAHVAQDSNAFASFAYVREGN